MGGTLTDYPNCKRCREAWAEGGLGCNYHRKQAHLWAKELKRVARLLKGGKIKTKNDRR